MLASSPERGGRKDGERREGFREEGEERGRKG